MDKTKLEAIQLELNTLTSRKTKQEKLYREVRMELGRIQDKIDELSKELINHLNNPTPRK